MKKPYLGIWLDHRQAYLIWMDEQGVAEVRHTEAAPAEGGEKADRTVAGKTGVYGAVAPHTTVEQKRRQQARRLYDRIIRTMRGGPQVYVFGPGQAKKELQSRLSEHKEFSGRVVAAESAGKMSEAQMVARVKKFFGLHRSVA